MDFFLIKYSILAKNDLILERKMIIFTNFLEKNINLIILLL